MRTSYGYDTYRGRTKLQSALTVLIVILLIVLLLAVAAFFFLQRYMVYTDDGQAHLELPFFQQEPPDPPVPTQNQPLVIVTPEPTETTVPTPTPAPETVEIPAVAPVSLFRAAVTEGSAQRLVTAAGGNAALLNMKANDGSLGFASPLPLAISASASAAEPDLNAKIQAITDSELYTIARVSCFKDNLTPKVDNSLAMKTNSGYNWRDGDDTRWMNPTVPAARQYVTGICTELADMGFDEILLDNSGWPTTGHLEYIKVGEAYDPANLTSAIETFYKEIREVLKDKEVLLSVSVNASALTGADGSSGQTAALLGEYADRVYVLGAETAGACDEALSAAGLTGNAVVYVEAKAADLSTTGRLITAAD